MSYSLTYGNTCPLIDDAIETIKSELNDMLSELTEELNPLFVECNQDLNRWESTKVTELYDKHFDSIIEELRQTNAALRENAEEIIEEANTEIEDLEDTISTLKE